MILYLLNFYKSLFNLLFKTKKYLEIQHLRYITEKQSEKFIESFCLNKRGSIEPLPTIKNKTMSNKRHKFLII